jgi:hypothetical protein
MSASPAARAAHRDADPAGSDTASLLARLALGFALCAAAGACVGCGADSQVAVSDAGPTAPSWDLPCGEGAACAGGLVCAATPVLSSGLCTLPCADGTPCPEGGACIDVPQLGARLCMERCAATGDCRSDLRCWRGVCQPPCAEDAHCGEGGRCEGGMCAGAECARDADCGPRRACAAGRCVDAPPGGDGAPCASAMDCEAPLRCVARGAERRCARACRSTRDCGDPTSVLCAPLPADVDGDGRDEALVGACTAYDFDGAPTAAACARDAECGAGACLGGECAEVCADASDCLAGHACVPASRAGLTGTVDVCGHTPVTAVTVTDVALGRETVTVGSRRRVDLAVPPDAVSVTLLGRQSGGADLLPITFVTVTDPTGAAIFDLAELEAWRDPPLRWLPLDTQQIMTMLVPNTTPDRLPFRGGRLAASVSLFARAPGDTATTAIDLVARVKRAPGGAISSGTLDLNVFCLATGLTAASAPGDARLQGALTRLRPILSAAGIALGTVRYFDPPPAAVSAYRVIDSTEGPSSELAQMFATSAGRTEQAINLFLIDRIAGASGDAYVTLGVSGGLPGPPGVHGTIKSGVAVSFSEAVVGSGTTGQARVAQIAAHEIGHYLGLFHVRESLAPCRTGTGPTASAPCAPFGGGDVLADTAPSDTRNLMYWSSMGGTTLTAGQRHVLVRSALVR